MEYLTGLSLALATCAFAALVGFDRDRVFYPTLLTVIASYYILFAVMGSSTPALVVESLIAAAFFALAVIGFRRSLWLVVAALAAHGVFDVFHHRLIRNPGVPLWWPGFCLSFDLSPPPSLQCCFCADPDPLRRHSAASLKPPL